MKITRRELGFPHQDDTSTLVYVCGSFGNGYFYIYSDTKNLVDGETRDGHSVHQMRVKFDDGRPFTLSWTQEWGSAFFHPSNYREFENYFNSSAKQIKVEFKQYGLRAVVYTYNIEGFNKELCNG